MQRPAHFATRALPIEFFGFLQGIRIHGDRSVQLVVVQGNACEVLLHQIPRCGAPFLHCLLHFRNGGFDHRKGSLLRACNENNRREQERRNDGVLLHLHAEVVYTVRDDTFPRR